MKLSDKEYKRLREIQLKRRALGASWTSFITSQSINQDLSKHNAQQLRAINDFLAYVKKNFTTFTNRNTDHSIRSKVRTAQLRKGAVEQSTFEAQGPVKVYRYMQKLNVANEQGLVAGPNGSLLKAIPQAMRISLSDPHIWPSSMFGCGEIWVTGSLQDILRTVHLAQRFSCQGNKVGRYENYGGGSASNAGGELDQYLDAQVGKGEEASHDIMAELYTHLYAGAVVQESDKNYTVEADAAKEIVQLVGSKLGGLAGEVLSPAVSNPFTNPMDAIGWAKDTAESPLPFSQESAIDKGMNAIKRKVHNRSLPPGGMFSLCIGSEIHPDRSFAAKKEWGNSIAKDDLVAWLQGSSSLKGR